MDKRLRIRSDFNFKDLAKVLSIASSLHTQLLISNTEKLKLVTLQTTEEMKAAILDLMLTKNSVIATKIFLKIRAEAKEKSKSILQNPMEINVVVKNVLKFLQVEDLKNCRVVCKNWNFEAEPLIRKKATITFGYLSDSTEIVRHPENFFEAFRFFSASTTTLPFTSFRFLNEVEWRVPEFQIFFNQRKKVMQELELHDVFICNEDGDLEEEYDVSEWFSNLSLSKLTLCCNELRDYDEPPTHLTLSLNVLASTAQIALNNCRVKTGHKGNGRPIAPIGINFTNLQFFRNDVLLTEYCLNDVIDFSKARDIKITCIDRNGYTIPILDISKCTSAKCISLVNVSVVNWKDAKSVVETLEMVEIPFLDKPQMEIKKLLFMSDSIDLVALPSSIENLHFGNNGLTTISSSQPVALPKLNYLKIEHSDNFPDLVRFANCSNLRYIEICNVNRAKIPLNLEWIPCSVVGMRLEGVKAISGGDGEKLKLEKLVLINYSLSKAAKFMKQIVPNTLVLQWKKKFETNGCVLSFSQNFNNLVLTVGPFIWDDTFNVFENCSLSAHVDQKAEYYVFDKNKGRSIPNIKNELLLK